jgi:CRISPR/Cas system endoribonuclease Cas6 (RAMP superfamily)
MKLPQIQIINQRIHLIAREQIIFPPFPGAAFRSAFGAALRRTCCTMKAQTCPNCMLNTSCVYAMVFETQAVHVQSSGYQLKDFPRPFVMTPQFPCESHILKNDSFYCDLILMGRAIEYLPYFIYSFETIGKSGIGKNRGKYVISHMIDQTNETIIFDGPTRQFTGTPQKMDISKISMVNPGNVLKLTFLTPTRIKYQNQLTHALTFELLIKNLLRRLKLLAQMTSIGWTPDFSFILDQAKQVQTIDSNLYWYDWHRYSVRQQRAMKLGGFMGDISFDGDFLSIMPLIEIGQYMHVGKACTFGLGKYRINLS